MRAFIVAMLCGAFTFAQIGESQKLEESVIVGEVKMPYKGLEYYEIDGQKFYILSFRNAEYPSINDIRQLTFYASNEELEYLYQFLKNGFGNKEQRILDIGEDRITTNPYMGAIALTIYYKDGSKAWTDITKRQLDRLFEKNKYNHEI